MRTKANGEHFITRDAELPPSRQVTHHYGGMCPHRPRIVPDERLPFVRIGGPDNGDNGIMHSRRCNRTVERLKDRPFDLDL